MDHIKEYMEDLASRIAAAETEEVALKLADEAHVAGRAFKKLWQLVPGHDDLAYAIVNDLQHFESMADLLSKEADLLSKEAEKYGTYDEQVRATYYGGQI